ncbi:ribonuclease III [Trichlorobacter ammonificans]|uniref:Ribonuclease 3 n=1 Tax=Trichlorobacter ammonificans TaxID=2916410 RepID=A0ABM9D908_9BACT|nr:ribonuclease III [Trichlorobacter ammonificans]CAH2031193.1 Ribonuclease 3 [Trichlorobacter ammonificans]
MSVSLQNMLGHSFSDESLLRTALTHPSRFNEAQEGGDYQRLEFLGDAVLGLLLADLLYQRFAHLGEGELSRLRASLVDQTRLAELALTADIAPHILLGRGEERDSGRDKPSILADVLEAVIGAIYLDGGLPAARSVVEALYAPLLDDVTATTLPNDPKSRLQEWLAAQRLGAPYYELLAEEGPPHDRRYTVGVSVDGTVWGTGTGRSKKAAQQEAARAALKRAGEEGSKLRVA